jgi:hypothetical protein
MALTIYTLKCSKSEAAIEHVFHLFTLPFNAQFFFPQLLSKSNRCPARTLRMHHTSVWLKAMPTMAHPSTIHPTHPFQASPGLSAHQEDSTVSFKTAIQT